MPVYYVHRQGEQTIFANPQGLQPTIRPGPKGCQPGAASGIGPLSSQLRSAATALVQV